MSVRSAASHRRAPVQSSLVAAATRVVRTASASSRRRGLAATPHVRAKCLSHIFVSQTKQQQDENTLQRVTDAEEQLEREGGIRYGQKTEHPRESKQH